MMIVWFLAAGAFAGVCAGLFGVGGGMIIVPALVWIFTAYGYSPEIIAHLAVGTSLATIIVTSISSLTAHNKRGGVRWDVWKNMAIGLVIGSLLGAAIAEQIHGLMLQALIGAGALLIAFKMLFLSNKENLGKALPSAPVQVGAGSDMVRPCLTGAIGFAWFGQNVAELPPGAVGFVHVIGFICISFASFITAKLGAKWAHQLPAATLKKSFGVLLLMAGSQLLWSGLSGMNII